MPRNSYPEQGAGHMNEGEGKARVGRQVEPRCCLVALLGAGPDWPVCRSCLEKAEAAEAGGCGELLDYPELQLSPEPSVVPLVCSAPSCLSTL